MEKVNMNEIKMNVACLCAYMRVTTDELADMANISRSRLMGIRTGRIRMSGDDLLGLYEATGMPMENIQTAQEMQ
jgi:transcriptional regulator with XRE-family HTH domain